MSKEELESRIKEFIEFAEKFSEPYRQKIFETLLTNYLKSEQRPEEITKKAEVPTPPQKFVIPIGVRALLQQYNIPEDNIQKLFLIEGNEIQPIFKIKTTKKSDAQMEVAFLIALENALKPNGKFEFSIEIVRQRCKDDYKIYDQANFKANFKNNTRFFKNLDEEEHVELSTDGKAELAEAIVAITG